MTSESDELKDAKHAAVNLKPAELRDLKAFIDMRLSMAGAVTAVRPLADEILDQIIEVCRAEGIEAATQSRLRNHPAYKTYAEKCEEYVKPFLDHVQYGNRVRKHALIRCAIRLLIKNLKKMNVPVSALMTMNHIHRMQSVVDDAFPGYAKNGLLYMVVRVEGASPAQDRRPI